MPSFLPSAVFRNKSLGAAHTRGEGITQAHDYQEVGIIETILEASEFGL